MSAPSQIDSARIGRFDQSFLVLLIRDFFAILVLVTAVEFGVKAALVYYTFSVRGEQEVEAAAEEIAGNVRSIMLNEGGPVAARTLYPILRQNWSDLGYRIAVEPAPVTVAAIRQGFGFTPSGIPAGDWPEGGHREARLDIRAEEFCLACHVTAEVGQVLGTVTVRNYLAQDFQRWWQDIRLSAGLAIGKILLHSVLLFLLLRARMEPLLQLRAVVARLARAYGTLDHRAEIRSADEFGALAQDLNLFLDRVNRLVGELGEVLSRVVAVNDGIVTIQGGLRGQVDAVVARTRALERRAMLAARREPMLSAEWFDAAREAVAGLDAAVARAGAAPGDLPGDLPGAERLLGSLRAVIAHAEAQIATNEAIYAGLADLGAETESFQASIAEMIRLEERMKGIIETGSLLVRRLRPETRPETCPPEAPG